MVGINNTASNSFVLASLRQTNKDIAASQTRIGTGLKINGASDGAAAYSMAQSIRSDIKTQSSLTGGISVAKAQTDAAVAGLDQINTLLGKLKDLGGTVANLTAGDDASASVIKQAQALQTQIAAVITASGFQGKNFLTTATDPSVQIGSDTSATISVGTEDITAEADFSAVKTAVDALTVGTSTNAAITALVDKATTAMDYVTGYQATLGSFSSTLDSQVDFLKTLDGIKNTALSSIVDADLEEESAKVTSLQVKQQLAYQALAITNSSSQNILRLFQ